MDESLRRRLERKADRLEHRLGVIVDEATGELRPATTTEQQVRAMRLGGAAHKYVIEVEDEDDEPTETTSARQARELLERYAEPQRNAHDPRVAAQRGEEREREEWHGRRKSKLTTTQIQAMQMRGETPDDDDD